MLSNYQGMFLEISTWECNSLLGENSKKKITRPMLSNYLGMFWEFLPGNVNPKVLDRPRDFHLLQGNKINLKPTTWEWSSKHHSGTPEDSKQNKIGSGVPNYIYFI